HSSWAIAIRWVRCASPTWSASMCGSTSRDTCTRSSARNSTARPASSRTWSHRADSGGRRAAASTSGPQTDRPSNRTDRMTYETLLVDVVERVATITINRPDKRNALNATVRHEIIAALDALRDRSDVGVVVFTG